MLLCSVARVTDRSGRSVFFLRQNKALGEVIVEFLGMTAESIKDCMLVVALTDWQTRIGIIVNTVIGEQDISIKALLDYLNKSSWIKGAAIIGDAKAVIMVNTLDVIKEIGQWKSCTDQFFL